MVQVHARLGDDPLQAPSLAALAAMAGLSRFQLLRHFEAAYGLTPHAWLLQRRTEPPASASRAAMPWPTPRPPPASPTRAT